jgi:hypothetical protein
MFSNPVHTKKGDAQYGLRVTLIVKDMSLLSVNSNTELDKYCEVLKTYCKIHNITFTVREYSSKLYYEDCENICRLPACHVYKNNMWLVTLYNKNDINEKIQSEIAAWKKQQELIRLKREIWKKRMNTIKSLFGVSSRPKN